MHGMKSRSAFALGLLLACGSTGPSKIWQQQLDEARERWEQNGSPSYVFHYRRQCFCPELALRVTVASGAVTTIHDLTADTAFATIDQGYTIPALLDRVQEFIDRPVAALTVTYHASTGVPLTVAADPIANAVDDENGFTVTEFVANP
jgi:hypothetical protein